MPILLRGFKTKSEVQVAASVAGALKATLTGAEHSALQQRPTDNPDAYDAYLRGLAYSLRPGVYESDILNAIKYFGQAVALDPKFALAWGGWRAKTRWVINGASVITFLPCLKPQKML